MFPPGSAGGYGQEGGQNLLTPSMYTSHAHTHMLPYNSYSAQLVQPSTPSPSMWQTPAHTALAPTAPPTEQTFSPPLGFNCGRDGYLQGAGGQSLQAPISPYQAYAQMNHGVWRHYDSMGLQGIASKYEYFSFCRCLCVWLCLCHHAHTKPRPYPLPLPTNTHTHTPQGRNALY